MEKMNQTDTPSKKLISELSFCVFDLETTGGNHLQDKIIEIGLVKIKNLTIVDQKKYFIQPDIKIPDFIQKLTTISSKDLENAPRIESVIQEVLDFMGDSILVAHNIAFDIPFFNSVLKRMNLPELSNNGLCTNLMTKYLIPNLLNTNLHYMSKLFGIKLKKAHRALDDAKASADLLLCFLNIFINKNINKINHLYYPRNKYELDRTNFKNNKDSPQNIIDRLQMIKSPWLINLKGKEGVILFSLPSREFNSSYFHNKKTFKEGIDLIAKELKNLPWENATINLYGSFFEALCHFTQTSPKFSAGIRDEIFHFLRKSYLKEQKATTKENPLPFDFVLSNHLVPEQYIIFPLQLLHPKSNIVFRYPGHEKKLIQFLNSKITRLNNKKFAPEQSSESFLIDYLKLCAESNQELLLIDRTCLKKGPDDFYKKIEEFMKNNPNNFNYPKEYI